MIYSEKLLVLPVAFLYCGCIRLYHEHKQGGVENFRPEEHEQGGVENFRPEDHRKASSGLYTWFGKLSYFFFLLNM